MERSIKVSLEKAREWYNSGNESLREVALQAFEESELIGKPWEFIKTFEDACTMLHISPVLADFIYDDHLQNMYKLKIIKKALNGVEWEPDLNTGIIYYPWMRYYLRGYKYNSDWKPVANFKAKENNKVYTLTCGGYSAYGGGLGNFGCGFGDVYSYLGLFGCKSKEIAEYFGKTFGKLIFDAIYSQYNNYTWVEK